MINSRMSDRSFSLVPFDHTNNELKIEGNIKRKQNVLNVSFRLVGNLDTIVILSPNNSPTRQHELWKNTCFEFFIGIKDTSQYWEFNLAPTGDWNIYHFQDYRQGMAEAQEFSSLPFFVERRTHFWQLNLELDLSPIIAIEQDLEIGVTAVIKFKTGQLSYWALTHSAAEADFHQRDSFVIQL